MGDHLLKKFFAFHIIAPFVLLMVIALHLALIHSCGNTPRIPSQHYKSESKSGKLFPDFIEEDRRTCMLVTMVMVHFVCFKSFYFDNSSNNLMADRMSTPKHIVPEWYFLPFYFILKIVPSKNAGILSMLGLMFFPAVLPYVNRLKSYTWASKRRYGQFNKKGKKGKQDEQKSLCQRIADVLALILEVGDVCYAIKAGIKTAINVAKKDAKKRYRIFYSGGFNKMHYYKRCLSGD